MGALKGIVIGMGVLIVVGMAALGVGIYQKSATPPMAGKGLASAPGGAAVSTPFGEVAVSIGEGCRITGMEAEGARLYLNVGPDGPCRKIIAIDAAEGRVLGTLRVSP